MSEKPLHLHLAELPWLLFFFQGDRRRPRVSGLVSFGCQEQEEQRSRAGKVTSRRAAGAGCRQCWRKAWGRWGVRGQPSISAQPRACWPVGVGNQYPGLVSQRIPSQPGSARSPSNRVRFLFDLWRVEPLPGRVQSAFPGQDRPTSLVPGSPRWRAPPPGQSRCGAGAGEGWSGGKDLEWVTQGGGAKNSRSLC